MLDELTERVQGLVDGRDALGFDVRFDLGETGDIFVAGHEAPMRVSNDDQSADTVLRLSADDFSSLLDRSLDPTMAFMQGKLRVDGDLSRAMQLTGFFS